MTELLNKKLASYADKSDDLKFDLLSGWLKAAFGFLSGNIILNLFKASESAHIEDILANIKKLMEEYVAPYLGFLAMYSWGCGPNIVEWLHQIESSIIENAGEEFDSEAVLEIARKELQRGREPVAGRRPRGYYKG